ncbi:four helix bundle protein [bacterium]|nr:four helix bundle protein [bacterium]
MRENAVLDKSFDFAVRVVNLYKFLVAEKKEFVLSKQILRSGTSIGAMVREAQQAESKADFVHKLSIALKEANETDYWLLLLKKTDYIESVQFESLKKDIDALLKLLVSIIKKSKEKKR